MTRRRGFTLVEVAIFSAIGMMLLGVLWTVFGQSARKGGMTEEKLQAVQHAQLLALALERDLAGLYEDATHETEFRVAPDHARLAFYRFGPTSAEGEWKPLPLERVVYFFDREQARVFRKVGDGPEQVLHGRFERLAFRLTGAGASGADSPKGLLPEGPALVYSGVGLATGASERPESDRRNSERSVLTGGVVRPQAAAASAYPFWNPVDYGPPAP